MAIGIDVDDVLFPFVPHFCRFLNWKYGLNLSEKDIHSYQMWKVYHVTMQQNLDDIGEFSETPAFRQITPYEHSIEGVKQLRELDSLLLITSRRIHFRKHTENQINYFFPGLFSSILLGNAFPQSGKEVKKRELCNENSIWLMLEDCKSYALDISRDIPVIVPAKPWNLEAHGSNIIRVSGMWKRIPEVAQELSINPYCLLD